MLTRFGQQVGQASGERETPNRRHIGLGGASEVEPIGRRLRCDPFVRKDAAGAIVDDFQTAEYSGNIAWGSGGVGESHAIDREGGGVVEVDHSRVDPLAKHAAGAPVPLRAGGFAWYVDVRDVERAARVECIDVHLGQHVVGRGDHVVDGAIAVAESWKRSKAWHQTSMPVLDCIGCNDLRVMDNNMGSMRTVLCDLDGVVWLAREPIPGSSDAVARLRASGRRVVFVTNNSAARVEEHIAALLDVGIRADGDIVSSSTAAALLIVPGERVLVAGGPGVVQAVESRGGRRCDQRRDGGRRTIRCGDGWAPPRFRLRTFGRSGKCSARWSATDRDQLRFDLPDAAGTRTRRWLNCRSGRIRG